MPTACPATRSRQDRSGLLGLVALALLTLASVLYAAVPSAALVASAALALATVIALPVVFTAVLAGAHALSERSGTLSTLAVALGGVRATTVRSIALAATGAVALFGSVALGGARSDLLAGIHSFARDYTADAAVWVSEPGDNHQATGLLRDPRLARRIARMPGVASVSAFQGGFLTLGQRRVWVLARAPGAARHVLDGAGARRSRDRGRARSARSRQAARSPSPSR